MDLRMLIGEIVEEAGGEVVGMACVVETFAGGRTLPEARGWPVWSLVAVAGLEDGEVRFGRAHG